MFIELDDEEINALSWVAAVCAEEMQPYGSFPSDESERMLGPMTRIKEKIERKLPDQIGILREGDTIYVRYGFGRLSPEEFKETGDHLAETFPRVKFLLLEADEIRQEPAGD